MFKLKTFTAQIRDSLIEKDGTSKEEKFQVSFNFGVRKLIKEKMTSFRDKFKV